MSTFTTHLDFGGFYHSIHSDKIDHKIELYNGDDSGEIPENFDWDKIEYATLHDDYSISYLRELSRFIKNEFDLNITFEFIKVDSPKYYNYATDKIECKVKGDINELNELLLEGSNNYPSIKEGFSDYVRSLTTSVDGYSPFYTYNEVMNDKEKLSWFALDYIALCEFNTQYDIDPYNEYFENIKEDIDPYIN